MTIELFEALSLLKDTLKHDKRFILLDEIEKELENDDEVKIKAYQVDVASIAYNDILKIYDVNSDEAKAKQKILYEKKKELDSLEIVKKYNKAYREVFDVYQKINEEIFFPLSPSLCHKGK